MLHPLNPRLKYDVGKNTHRRKSVTGPNITESSLKQVFEDLPREIAGILTKKRFLKQVTIFKEKKAK